MKRFFKFVFVGLGLISLRGYAQCPNESYNIGDNPYVCATSYGDANGNSSWDWESTPDNNTNYCKMWQARTQSQNNSLEIMGSPFVNTRIQALYVISTTNDYTRAKGWELLTRNFGCSVPTSYPYFVLYNKYSGLARVFIYLPGDKAQYSGALLQITTIPSPAPNSRYPAALSGGDITITAPDKYLNPDSTTLTNTMFVVTQTAGLSNWSVAEFNPGFDPNIENSSYKGSVLGVTVFGVTNSTLTAAITGTSVSTTNPGDPVLSDISYRPNTTNASGTGSDGGKKFTATGEKFVKLGKTAEEVRSQVYSTADKIVNSLSNVPYNSGVKGRIKSAAWSARELTSPNSDIGKTLGTIASALGAGGQALNLIGGIVGMLSNDEGTPAAAPTYTAYNLELHGEITTKVVTTAFMFKIPGAIQDNSNTNNRDLATYYSCPLGIFNITNTPEADVVKYKRATEAKYGPSIFPGWSVEEQHDFVSYKLRNNLNASFNSGAGVELVSAQAAIVGKVLPTGTGNSNAAYDLLQEYNETDIGGFPSKYSDYTYNYMLPDLQAGILEVTNYDPDHKLHTFQTPYRDLGCLSGLTFNARAETDIFLRVKAILKKKNDPNNTPIYYIQDYKIIQVAADIDNDLRNNLADYNSHLYPTPYSNSSDIPRYNVVDLVINNRTYNSYWDEIADNSISTENTVLIKAGQSVVFKAGGSIELEDGFETEDNSQFEAILRESELNFSACSTPVVQAFVPTLNGGNCYNTIPRGLREATNPNNTEAVDGAASSENVKVYPVPTSGKLVITGINNSNNAIITILDQSGRTIQEIRSASYEASGRIDLDVSALTNGVYFVKVQTLTQTITKKIVVSK